MKKEITLTIEANTIDEIYFKFNLLEELALCNDRLYLEFVSEMNKGFLNNRRKRTRKEREQRAEIMGFDSYKDIAI